MINRITGVLICFLFYSVCVSQSKIYTSIQENKKKYPDKLYSFERVIDARANKDNIGTVYKTSLVNEYVADLHEPLDVEVMKFLNSTFPYGSPTQKVTVVINRFEIGHRLSGKAKDTGFVKINFDFYKDINNHSVLIYNYTGALVEVVEDVALTHANRMKRIILTAVSPLDSIVLKGIEFHRDSSSLALKLIPDSLKKSSNVYTKENVIVAENNEKKIPRRIMFMLGGHASFCMNTTMLGVNATLLYRLKKHPKALMGFNINFSKINFGEGTDIPANTSYKIKTSDFGLRYLRQIKNSFFYNFNPHFLIGKETITNYAAYVVSSNPNSAIIVTESDKSNLFIGAQFDNGIYLMFPSKSGPFFGIDLVVRITNSDIFDTDMGIKFNLGISF